MSSASAPTAIPSPDDNQRAGLLGALRAIEPSLADDSDQAVNYARNVCQYIIGGDTTGAEKYAVSRAAADGHTIDDPQAVAVVAAVEASFCR